jgi:hypothetical protein
METQMLDGLGKGIWGFLNDASQLLMKEVCARFRMYLHVCVCLHEGCVRCVLVITRIFRFSCH